MTCLSSELSQYDQFGLIVQQRKVRISKQKFRWGHTRIETDARVTCKRYQREWIQGERFEAMRLSVIS